MSPADAARAKVNTANIAVKFSLNDHKYVVGQQSECSQSLESNGQNQCDPISNNSDSVRGLKILKMTKIIRDLKDKNRRFDLYDKYEDNQKLFMNDFDDSQIGSVQYKLDKYFNKSILIPYLNDVFVTIYKNQQRSNKLDSSKKINISVNSLKSYLRVPDFFADRIIQQLCKG